MSLIVDIHCHTFNASDLPASQYAINSLLHGKKPVLGTLLKILIEKLLLAVPDRKLAEEASLLHLLNAEKRRSYQVVDAPFDPELLNELDLFGYRELSDDQFEAIFQDAFDKLDEQTDDRFLDSIHDELGNVIHKDLREQLRQGERALAKRETGIALKGLFGFVKLMYNYRYKNTHTLIESFPSVELFTPSVIDFGPIGWGGATEVSTSLQKQMLIHEQISILSVLGGPPGQEASWPLVHPMFTFNPNTPGSLDLVKEAILERGFVGVKLYPSQGWFPGFDNGEEANLQLRAFYQFCLDEEVPLMTHSSATAYHQDRHNRGHEPKEWIDKVLSMRDGERDYSQLRINFGHFGMGGEHDYFGRSHKIARMMNDYPHIYADTGNHHMYRGDYLEFLEGLYADPTLSEVKRRLMYGSDWFMVSVQKEHKKLARKNRDAFLMQFIEEYPEVTDSYMGGAAIRYLGLDAPERKNYQRLKAWYAKHELCEWFPTWLAY